MKSSWVCAWLVVSSLACGRSSITGDPGQQGAGASTIGDVASASQAKVAAAAPAARGSARSAGQVDPSELEIVEHTVSSPPRGKDAKEDYWIQFQIWGEMKNKSSHTVRILSADITFFDAQGKPVDIRSIGTAVKQDVHDSTPGETIYSETHQIPPGGSAPFHYMRNLSAIKGQAASHKLTLRPAPVVNDAAVGVALGVKESVGEMTNPALPDSKTMARRRAFEGTLRNDGKTGCRDPKLVVALLSPDGKIRETHAFDALATDNHKLTLAPNASVPFKGALIVDFDNQWREKAAVKSYVDCDEPY
ncbi:MAG TPA: hypothetical protein VLT33_01505 [Labilithrix sp.]|nr:hypothetical protein [Labilithrix sp.]